jgi:hypothetical protein
MENHGMVTEKALYAETVEKEFGKSVKLLPGELIENQKRGIVFGKVFQSPGIIAITNERIIFLLHHFFSPDQIVYISFSSISKINLKKFGFLRGGQMVIELTCGSQSILFNVTYIQKIMTGLGGPQSTEDFIGLLRQKVPTGVINENTVPIKQYDYYLLLMGLAIGLIMGGVLPIIIFAVVGFLIGKLLNKFL